MENNNGKGIFYGVIGVATLIVAIIGATFAYFTATTTSTEYVQGAAATAGLDVNVIRMTGASASELGETKDYIMVPQLDTTLDDAIVGTLKNDSEGRAPGTDGYVNTYNPCIDAGGSLVCSIYRIVVHNSGSAPITVSGSIDFYTSSTADGKQDPGTPPTGENGEGAVAPAKGSNFMNHLKWARLTQPDGVVDGQYMYANVKADGSLNANMPTTLLTYANNVGPSGNQGYQVTPDGTVYKYANVGTVEQPINQHLYAIEVGSANTVQGVDNIDLLNGYTVNGNHGRYTDLIDPTDDLTVTWAENEVDDETVKTATVAAGANKAGSWYLEANGTAGDTKAFYIVVWISENDQEQNKVDFGHFTGTVTFQSSAGSGATSTFTETAQG